MRYSLIAVAVAAFALGATGAQAQSCAAGNQSCSTTLSATMQPVVEFTGITGTFDFGSIGLTQYNAGTVAAPGPVTLTHHGNVPYTVTVNAAAAALGFVASHGDPDPLKPVADVTIHETTAGVPADVVLDATAKTLYQRLSKGGALPTAMTANMGLSYANDPPGAYSSTITFTITAN